MASNTGATTDDPLGWIRFPGFVHRLSIAQRIQVGFAIGSAVVVIVSLVAAVTVRVLSDTLTRTVDQVRLEQGAATSLKNDLSDEDDAVQGYLITGDSPSLSAFNAAHLRFVNDAAALGSRGASATDKATAAHVSALEATFQADAMRELALLGQERGPEAASDWQQQGRQAEAALRAALDNFIADRDRALSDTLTSAHRHEGLTRAIFAPIVMLVAGFGLFTALLASRSIKRRFENLTNTVERIEQGDLHVEPDVGHYDELGRLAVSIRDMARTLERESHQRDQLVAEGVRRHDELSALYDMARTVNQSLDTDEVLRLALSKLIAHTGTDAGLAVLRDDADGRFHLAVLEGLSAQQSVQAGALWDEERAQGIALQATQVEGVTRVDVSELTLASTPFRTVLAVPLGVRGEGRGLLFLAAQHDVRLSEDQERLIEGLQKQVGIALEHAWLYGQSARLAVAEERNRLARELHDSVSQALFSMSMMAQALPSLIERAPERAAERSERLSELARGALAEMRMLILELRPAALQELGLVSALERYVAGYGSREALAASMRVEGLQRRLPQDQEEAMFRVAQEALSNVSRHAQATTVDVTLEFEPDRVSLTVKDNGVGMAGAGTPAGFGMTTMRERAEQIGGTLAVSSASGAGTTIRAMVPAPAASTSIAG